ncbi:hypothetical protein AB6O49_15850 [Streptomyces sp. SBR177]
MERPPRSLSSARPVGSRLHVVIRVHVQIRVPNRAHNRAHNRVRSNALTARAGNPWANVPCPYDSRRRPRHPCRRPGRHPARHPAAAALPPIPDGSLATPNAITRIATTGLGLKDNSRSDEARVDAYLDTHAGVARTTLFEVLTGPGTTPARTLCHDSHIQGAQGFCWSTTDDESRDWNPQGVTQGMVNGRKAVVSSWYGPDGTERLSFADVTEPSAVRYRHVLLVGLSADGSGYAELRGGHANGVVWAGNRLYVASIGSGLDVFDTGRMWRTDAGTYVLPRVGSYQYTGAGTGCGTYPRPRCRSAPVSPRSRSTSPGPNPRWSLRRWTRATWATSSTGPAHPSCAGPSTP